MADPSFSYLMLPSGTNYTDDELRPATSIRVTSGTGNWNITYEWDTVSSFDSGALITRLYSGVVASVPFTHTGVPTSDLGPAGTTWYYRATVVALGDQVNEIQDVYNDVGTRVDEIQSLYNGATGGTFTVSYDGQGPTGDIGYNGPINGVASQGTLTMDTQPTDGDTMTVNGKTYTFQDTLTNVDGNVNIGGSLAQAQLNIVAAFDLSGVAGTDYATAMTAHTTVDIAAFATNQAVLTAKLTGTVGDAYGTTETFTAGTNVFDAATLGTTTAGVNGLKHEMEKLSNIATVAITGAGTSGDPWLITFTGTEKDLPLITTNDTNLTGGTPSSTIAESTKGNGGTFTLSYGGDTTDPMDSDASAATVTTELEALTSITDVTVTGTGQGSGNPWVVTFVDPGAEDIALMTADDTELDGSTTIAEDTPGEDATTIGATRTTVFFDAELKNRYLYLYKNIGVGFTTTDDPTDWGVSIGGTKGPDGDIRDDFDRYLYLYGNVGVGFDPRDTPPAGWAGTTGLAEDTANDPTGGVVGPGDGFNRNFNRYLGLYELVDDTQPCPFIFELEANVARVGDAITVRGQGLVDATDPTADPWASVVRLYDTPDFGGSWVNMPIVTWTKGETEDTIVVTVPAGATNGHVAVQHTTTPSCVGSNFEFLTVLPVAPDPDAGWWVEVWNIRGTQKLHAFAPATSGSPAVTFQKIKNEIGNGSVVLPAQIDDPAGIIGNLLDDISDPDGDPKVERLIQVYLDGVLRYGFFSRFRSEPYGEKGNKVVRISGPGREHAVNFAVIEPADFGAGSVIRAPDQVYGSLVNGIDNGGFEDGEDPIDNGGLEELDVDPWVATGTATIAVDQVEFRPGGAASLKVTPAASGDGTEQTIRVQPSAHYFVEGWAKDTSSSGDTAELRVYYTDSAGDPVVLGTDTVALGTSWQLAMVEVDIPAGVTDVEVQWRNTTGTTVFYVDDNAAAGSYAPWTIKGSPTSVGFSRDYVAEGDNALKIVTAADGQGVEQVFKVQRSTKYTLSARFTGYGGVKSQGTLTMDTMPTDGDTMTVDGKTYTFQTTLTDVDGNVAIGGSLAQAQLNIVAAFDLSGTASVDYALSTTAHATVDIAAFAANASILTAKTAGVAGDSIATTETFTAGTNVFDAATLGTTTAGDDPDRVRLRCVIGGAAVVDDISLTGLGTFDTATISGTSGTEQGTILVSITGLETAGQTFYLDDARAVPGEPAASPGTIMDDLLTQAQARSVLPWVSWNFTDALDSNGATWTDSDLSLVLRHWRPMGTALDALAGFGFDWEMTDQYELRVVNRLGVDLTVLGDSAPTIASGKLVADGDLHGENPRATKIYAEGAGGSFTSMQRGTWETDLERREAAVTNPGTSNTTTLGRLADAALDDEDSRGGAIKLMLTRGDAIVPFIDFDVGDTIWVDSADVGPRDKYRVVAIFARLETEADISYVVDLNRMDFEQDAALAAAVARLIEKGDDNPLAPGAGSIGSASYSSMSTLVVGAESADGVLTHFHSFGDINPANASGDLGGTYPAPIVTGIRGVPVAPDPPSNGDAPVYDSALGQYVPGAAGGGGGGGGMGVLHGTVVVPAGGQTNIDFNDIPAGSGILIEGRVRAERAGQPLEKAWIQFGTGGTLDTGSNYYSIAKDQTATTTETNTRDNGTARGQLGGRYAIPGATAAADAFSALWCVIPNHSDGTTGYRAYRSNSSVYSTTDADARSGTAYGHWANTGAIDTVRLLLENGDWEAGTTVSLYVLTPDAASVTGSTKVYGLSERSGGHAQDDDFNDGVLDSAWTVVEDTSPNITVTEGPGKGLSILHPGGDAAIEHHGLVKPYAPAGDFTIEAGIEVFGQPTNHTTVGVVAADGATYGAGEQVFAALNILNATTANGSNAADTKTRYLTNWNATDGGNSGENWQIPKGTWFVRLAHDSATDQWQFLFSFDGIHWDDAGVAAYTQAVTVSHIGIGLSTWGGTDPKHLRFTHFYVYDEKKVAGVDLSVQLKGLVASVTETSIVRDSRLDRLYRRPTTETAHGLDDEFEGTALDASWAAHTESGTATWSLVGDGSLHAAFEDQAAGDVCMLTKSLGSLTFPITLETALIPPLAYKENYAMFGLILTDGNASGSNAVVAMPYVASTALQQSFRHGTVANISSDYGTFGVWQFETPMWQQLIWTAANTFKYRVSGDGRTWTDLWGGQSKTMTATRAGLWVSSWDPTTTVKNVAFDYFRVTEADESL